ncbi:MAG: LytR/AlgR family response regulator transcription factor [Bacteroides sp.]|jgi:two-component system response regulator protein
MRCIIIDDDAVSRRILLEYVNQTDFMVSAGEFASSIEALNFLKRENGIDLVFLDVMLPNMDGFEFLDTLENPPQVIMVSASDSYAVRAFDFGATDYLLKPISYARFFKGVSKAMKWMHPTGSEGELFLKKNASLVRVPYSSILWVESMENYVKIITDNEKFTLHFTLKTTEGHMPPSMFRRIHRSYIVNITRIQSIEDSSVIMLQEGKPVSLPIGKSYKDALMSALRFITVK